MTQMSGMNHQIVSLFFFDIWEYSYLKGFYIVNQLIQIYSSRKLQNANRLP